MLIKPFYLSSGITTVIVFCMMIMISAHSNKAYGQTFLKDLDKQTSDTYNHLLKNVYNPEASAAIDSFLETSMNNDKWQLHFLAYRLKAYSLSGLGKLDEAIEMGRMAGAIANEHGEDEAYYESADFIVGLLSFEGKNYQALKEAQDMAKKAVNDKSQYGLIISNYCLGKIFSYRGDPQLSISYFEKEIDNMKGRKMHKHLYTTYLYLAQCYRQRLRNDKAMECIKLAEKYATEEIDRYNVEFTALVLLFDVITPNEFSKRYLKVIDNPLYHSVVDSETQTMLRIMNLISNDRSTEALALTRELSTPTQRLEMRISALKQLKRYEEAMALKDSLQLYNDSVQSQLQTEDLAAVEASMNDTKLQIEGERKVQKSRNAIGILVIMLLLVTTLSFAYVIKRRKRFIEDMRKKNGELISAQKQIEKALEMKTSFIHNMSHEIRTPLSQISGFSQVLATDDVSDEDKEEGRKIIMQQTEHLVNMLDTIIEISDFETRVDKPEMKEVKLKALLTDMMSTIPQPQKGVTLTVGNNTDPTLTVMTDAESLKRIIACLADNAVKFTSNGFITIDALENGKGQTIIEVADTGCGIKPENAQKVFERFFKENEFVPGAGLGLAIARMHAAYISVSLTLDTTVKKGSRFVISFT